MSLSPWLFKPIEVEQRTKLLIHAVEVIYQPEKLPVAGKSAGLRFGIALESDPGQLLDVRGIVLCKG